ncbi:MAG: metal-dependent hydrolase [Inhella sp.]
MFIAHLPAGYLLTRWLAPRLAVAATPPRWLMAWGLFGAIAPDLDLLYFFLIDNRQTHHHKYFPHWPLLWFALLLLAAPWRRSGRVPVAACCALVFALNGFVHQLLDSVVGDIWWFAPFVDRSFALAQVPARVQPWWLNFVPHWSFAIELGPMALAFGYGAATRGRHVLLHRPRTDRAGDCDNAKPLTERARLPLLCALLAHLLLDFLVGVHRNPLLWPFSPELLALDWGLLPSAGRLSLWNVYFWRNLAIELCVLLPLAVLKSPSGRQVLRASPWRLGLALLVGAGGAAVAFSLPR